MLLLILSIMKRPKLITGNLWQPACNCQGKAWHPVCLKGRKQIWDVLRQLTFSLLHQNQLWVVWFYLPFFTFDIPNSNQTNLPQVTPCAGSCYFTTAITNRLMRSRRMPSGVLLSGINLCQHQDIQAKQFRTEIQNQAVEDNIPD